MLLNDILLVVSQSFKQMNLLLILMYLLSLFYALRLKQQNKTLKAETNVHLRHVQHLQG